LRILIDKSFEKDIEKISDKHLLNSLADLIEEVRKLDQLSEIKHCKQLKGSKKAYRIRIGDYRVGFIFDNNTIIFIRFLHRSKIYGYFPD
jgi:mRNA interferase RelE/StbE